MGTSRSPVCGCSVAVGNDRTLLIAGGAGLLAVLFLRPQLPASVQAATPSLPSAPAVRDIVVNQTPAPQAGVGDYSALLGSLVALQRRQDNIVESVQRNAAPANPFTLPSINITLPTISNVVNPPAAAPVEDVVARVNETVKTIVSTASGIVTGEELALADVIDTGGPFFGVLGAGATGEQPFTDWQEKAADVVETATETLSEYMARIGIAPSGEDEEGLDDLDIFGSFTSGLPALAVPDVVAEGQAIVAAAAERFDVGALTSQARARADELAEQFADLEVVDTVRETAAAATEKLADLTANINLETLSAPTEAIRGLRRGFGAPKRPSRLARQSQPPQRTRRDGRRGNRWDRGRQPWRPPWRDRWRHVRWPHRHGRWRRTRGHRRHNHRGLGERGEQAPEA